MQGQYTCRFCKKKHMLKGYSAGASTTPCFQSLYFQINKQAFSKFVGFLNLKCVQTYYEHINPSVKVLQR
jgi:hypothetical protein